MAYNAYTVYGDQDGVIGVYSSWAKATEAALDYCGANAYEDHTDYSQGSDLDRSWDVRHFEGDLAGAHINRWIVQ